MNHRLPPLFLPAIALICGIIAVSTGATWLFVLIPLLISVALFILRKRSGGVLCLWMAAGMVTSLLNQPGQLPMSLSGHPGYYRGMFSECSDVSSGVNLTVTVDSVNDCPLSKFKARIFVPESSVDLRPYRRVSFYGTLDRFEPYSPDLPDETYLPERLIRKGISCSALVRPDSIHVGSSVNSFQAYFYRLNTRFRYQISRLPVDRSTASFFLATLAADDDWLSEELRSKFSLTGTAHVLALSGMHVAVITSLLLVVLLPLGIFNKWRWKWPVVIISLWLFALLTGMPASVVRAVIMATLLGLGKMLQRKPVPLNSLCAAAIIILIFSPAQLFSLGFQLSFLAVAAILLLARPLNPIGRKEGREPWISKVVCVTIAATIATSPLCAYTFHTLPVYFLAANLVLLPGLSVLMYLALVLLLMKWIGINADIIGRLTDTLFECLQDFLDFLVTLPGNAVGGIDISPLSLALYYGAIILLVITLHTSSRRRVWLTSTLVLAMLAFSFDRISTRPEEEGRVEVYIPVERHETLLLVRSGSKFLAVSSLPTHLSEATDIAARRWPDYMRRRNIDSLTVVGERSDDDLLGRRGNLVRTSGRNFLILSHVPDSLPSIHVDYLVICRGFRGDIMEVIRQVHPDSVILSSDLHPRRARRYEQQLVSLHIPHASPPVRIISTGNLRN